MLGARGGEYWDIDDDCSTMIFCEREEVVRTPLARSSRCRYRWSASVTTSRGTDGGSAPRKESWDEYATSVAIVCGRRVERKSTGLWRDVWWVQASAWGPTTCGDVGVVESPSPMCGTATVCGGA